MQAPVKLAHRIMLTLNLLVWLFAGYSIGVHLRGWHNHLEAQPLVAAPCAPRIIGDGGGPYEYYNFRSSKPGADEGLVK